MSKFMSPRFSVGANDPEASRRFADNYDLAFGNAEQPQEEPQLEEHVFVSPERQCRKITVEGAIYCRRCGKVDPQDDVACSRA